MNRGSHTRYRGRCFLVAFLLLALPGVAVAPADSEARPRAKRPHVKIVKAPATRTSATKAVFRFKRSKATKTWCRRDKRPYQRCRSRDRITYAGLRPGRHKFIVRARRGGRTVRAQRRWTVTRAPRGLLPRAPLPSGPLPGAPLPSTPLPPAVGSPIFVDEFNGASLDTTRWNAWHGPGNRGVGLRRASALTVSNGSLVVTAQTVNGQIVSGGMSHKANYVYGRYEFRVRTERDSTGTMSGIVMTWPKTQWSPEFTENDMYETGADAARNSFDTYIHYGTSYTTQKEFRHHVDATQWHTIVMDWRADSLKIYRDGLLVWTVTDRAAIPDVMHHLGIQLDPYFARTLPTPVRMYVDYVRMYR